MAVTAVLLSAGYATRLYPLTKDRPKALLPIGEGARGLDLAAPDPAKIPRLAGRTILDEIIASLRTVPEVRATLLVTNHRFAGQFNAWRKARSAAVRILDDGTDTAETRIGASGDLQLARQAADPGDDLLVIGTDNLFGWPLREFVQQAQRRRPAPSVALWQAPSKESATRFGVVVRDRDGRVTAFAEKSPNPPSTEVALCVYYYPAAVAASLERFLEGGGNPDAPGYFVEWLVAQGPVYGILMSGAWHDIGTWDTYRSVVAEWPASTARGQA